ncbi:hypothetical protein BABINDRAFT_158987 [Babjeviella inositovora NRRL Y-12698]|uniref:Proteasome subunit beta n=1 Tax=Babjeviella inositovora NRRL Y-12698 TaxID=984486 RepID=A0A1E3QXI0_9ASCO|nr:uncharacterized protein BABINDRAFT_158987 [Babjeviella inositovora NRRL Y-12698]ODQ82380.1 hypothetical protein BABINDRAFT_158987 [Babjeviella inositovora NRRL Y-12698]
MQKIERLLDDLEISEGYDCSGHELKAPHIHEYLSRVFYNRRSKMDPLWNSVIVGGFDEQDKPFLAYVDLLGVTYSAPTLASGFGAHLAIPLLRKAIQNDGDEEKLTEEQAREVMVNCMKVLFYRDARSMDKYTLVTIKKSGAKVESDLKVENMQWGFAKDIKGYGSAQV